jgi:archaellum component FlaF (FlaF/FlaG flagellin family)
MKFLLAIVAISTFVACSSNNKRVTVLFRGKAVINTSSNSVELKDGAGNEEQVADFTGSTISIKKSDGSMATASLPEPGLYILNGREDTVIGSLQKYSDPKKTYDTITQDFIKHSIDSLKLLVEGKNISASNHNFYILPYAAQKITNNVDAFLVTPFHRMTSIEKNGDKNPEVYRFWSIKEIRETINKLAKDTVHIKI